MLGSDAQHDGEQCGLDVMQNIIISHTNIYGYYSTCILCLAFLLL